MTRLERCLINQITKKYSAIPELGVCFPAALDYGNFKTYGLGFERTTDKAKNRKFRHMILKGCINTPANIIKKVPFSLRFKNVKYTITDKTESCSIDFAID